MEETPGSKAIVTTDKIRKFNTFSTLVNKWNGHKLREFDRLVDLDKQLDVLHHKGTDLSPAEVLYTHGLWETKQKVYEHFSEETVRCTGEDQVIIPFINRDSKQKLLDQDLLIIHIGLVLIKITGLTRSQAGGQYLGSQGIKAIEGKVFTTKDLAGKEWNITLPATQPLVPSQTSFWENNNKSVGIHFSDYRTEGITEPEFDDEHSNPITHTLMEEDEYDLPYPQQSSQFSPPKWDDEIPILMNEETGSSSTPPQLWEGVIGRWESSTILHCSNITFANNQEKVLENLLGETVKYYYLNWVNYFLAEYNRLVASADNTQNVTGQIRQLIIGYDPFKGTTKMQDKALQDIERLIIENMRHIDNYSYAFLNLASKSRQAFTQNMSDKYFSKIPPPFNSIIKDEWYKVYPTVTQGIAPRIVFTKEYLKKKCIENEVAKQVKDYNFCKQVYIPGYFPKDKKRIRRATNYRNGIPRKNHIRKFKRHKPPTQKCRRYVCGEEGHFARECRNKRGNTERFALNYSLDLPQDFDIVSIDQDDPDNDSDICSIIDDDLDNITTEVSSTPSFPILIGFTFPELPEPVRSTTDYLTLVRELINRNSDLENQVEQLEKQLQQLKGKNKEKSPTENQGIEEVFRQRNLIHEPVEVALLPVQSPNISMKKCMDRESEAGRWNRSSMASKRTSASQQSFVMRAGNQRLLVVEYRVV
ncbi:hypothetical protein K1719_012257 [Acacia pycnantha]|nr:hypothetical protein K1719_012257 [Acacia pycnantha]